MVVTPELIPVARPLKEPTVAIRPSVLLQSPPVNAIVATADSPTQRVPGAEIGPGVLRTEIVVTEIQPSGSV